jgi:hypothetical protein
MMAEYNTNSNSVYQRSLLQSRMTTLQSERSSWIPRWRELSTQLMPHSTRFTRSDRNSGTNKFGAIFDNTASRALRILSAGMMSGMTSPARPWFRLGLEDADLMDYGPVKDWLAEVRSRMLRVFARSNTYMALHNTYGEIGAFGTSVNVMLDDYEKILHMYESPVGEFMLASDYKGNVNTLYREFEKTVAELVGEFGYNNCSTTVKKMYDNGNLDTWVPVVHVVEPRTDRDLTKRNAKNKPWKSCYFEPGSDRAGEGLLRESGFNRFPVLAPRWHKASGDVYGNSPGMEAFGDIKQLQHEQLRKANGIDYMTKPPLQVPIAMKGREINILPSGLTYVDQVGPQNAVRSLFDVNINLEHLLLDINDVRARIRDAFYADLFLMLANSDNTNMTATEVAERHEEKLLMLGPVLERLHNELLSPLIDYTFELMVSAGALPPPPAELQGREIRVEFISMLAQAQRAVGVNSVDRFVGSLGMVAQYKPDVLDKLDADKWADAYGDMLGVDPELIVPNEKVAVIRQARAEAQAQAQQLANAQMEADAAAKLGTVKTDEKNAASDLLNMFSGYNSPTGVEV